MASAHLERRNMKNKVRLPIQAIIESLDGLTPSEVVDLCKALKVCPCERLGHKYRPVGKSGGGIFKVPMPVVICERCGVQLKGIK